MAAARADDRVVGLALTGSRGRGPFARPDSDWDVRLIAREVVDGWQPHVAWLRCEDG